MCRESRPPRLDRARRDGSRPAHAVAAASACGVARPCLRRSAALPRWARSLTALPSHRAARDLAGGRLRLTSFHPHHLRLEFHPPPDPPPPSPARATPTHHVPYHPPPLNCLSTALLCALCSGLPIWSSGSSAPYGPPSPPAPWRRRVITPRPSRRCYYTGLARHPSPSAKSQSHTPQPP